MITILHIRVLFFLFWVTLSFSQLNWNSNKDKIVIPFELTDNLIIVDVVINEVGLKMILDTGSERNLLFSFPENDSIEFYSPKLIKVKGLGYGESLEAVISSDNKFTIKNESLVDSNFEILLITNQNIGLINKLGVPINGIIGSSFFKDYLLEIKYSSKKIVIYKKRTSKINKRYKSKKIDLIQYKPYINLKVSNNSKISEFNLLFDTGLSDGLWLFENDTIESSKKFFNDVLGKGLGGDINGKKSRVEELYIDTFNLKDALVSYPDSISVKSLELFKNRNGSLGGEIIKRFDWFLDYQNSLFFYKKNSNFNDPFNYNMSGIEVQHDGVEWVKEVKRTNESSVYNNVDALEYVYNNSDLKNAHSFKLKNIYNIYSVRENSPAYLAGVREGDKIVSINNKNAYSFTLQKINDLFQSEEGKKIKLEVEREGEILEFEFYLEKIL